MTSIRRHRIPDSLVPQVVRSLLRRPWRIAVVDDQRTWRAYAVLVGAWFAASWVGRGSKAKRVGIMLPTSGMFPVALLGVWLARRTPVPLNYLLKPSELEYVIRDAELDAVITVRPMLERFGDLPEGVTPLFLEDMPRRGIPRPRFRVRFKPAETAILLYTSGTSGKPKGVELTHRGVAANVIQSRIWGQVTRADVFLGVLPQFHAFGLTVLTLLPMATGSLAVYTAEFKTANLRELMRKHHPTGFIGVPAMYNAFLLDRRATADDFSSFRFLISGGEPLPPRVKEKFESRFGRTISQGYGLTETGPVLNWLRPQDHRPESVGKPLPGVDEIIVDEAGRRLPPGQAGEVRVKGPNVMKGYFKLPEANAKAFDRDGYLKTGDIGMFDEAGNLYLTGRISDLIIVAGENVYPREVEEVINGCPGVADSSVTGVPDDARGQVPAAFVELAEDADLDETAIRAWCRERLARYKVPRYVVIVEKLPRTATNKVARKELPLDLVASRRRGSGDD
ncbi:MAG: class I adenylate-forming enzyme family protein [Dehalococcoidia bacterium]